MATYDAASLAALSFVGSAAPRVALAAKSLAALTFLATANPHVTYTAHALTTAQFNTDANPIKSKSYAASAFAPYSFEGTSAPGKAIYASSSATWSMVGTGTVCTAGLGLQVNDALSSIYAVWGATCHSDGCSSDMGEEAVNCLNAAFQRLAASGKYHAFIQHANRTASLTDGVGDITGVYQLPIALASDVQSVFAPVSLVMQTVALPGAPTVAVIDVANAQIADFNIIWLSPPDLTGSGSQFETTSIALADIVDELNAHPDFSPYWTAVLDSGVSGLRGRITITALSSGPELSSFRAFDPALMAYAEFVDVVETAGIAPTASQFQERRALRPLASVAAIQSFSQSYTTSAPLAYFVEQLSPGSLQVRLAPTPTLSTSYEVLLEYSAVLKPTRFSCQSPWDRIPVPHSYAETILLPLAKYFATASRFFKGNAEIKEAITAQAKEVLMQLGDIDPNAKEAK